MLPRSLKPALVAPRGYLLIVLDAIPERKGEIILPPGYRNLTRTSTGTVYRVGPRVAGYEQGDRVLLAASIGRPFELGGWGPGEDVEQFWRVHPSQVMLRLPPESPEGTNLGEDPMRNRLPEHGFDGRLVQGEPGALR